MRQALIELHQRLVDAERRDYERLRGSVSDGEFLGVMVNNRDFSWLGSLTTLIVSLDESPRSECLAQIRSLITPGADGGEFNRKYGVILQRNPDLAGAHHAVLRELEALALDPGG